MRFALYHLNGAANPADERVSIGARALTGDDYRGHVFWDTEIYLLPFYTLTWPEAARALLMYRFHTLDGARAKAAGMGWRGALYAWESADTGAETTPEQVIGPDRQVVDVLCGKQEQHISADVAYAVWQYWQATGDEAFLRDAGAEILLETARFWASRAELEADGCRHIRGVIGPDEYHEHIDDNAFTNVMARWNIRRALDVAALLRERWPERWARLSVRIWALTTPNWSNGATSPTRSPPGLDPETGLFEQFAGISSLEDIDLADYAGRSVPMDVVLGRERTQKSQVVKQADVVALLALLPEEFPGDIGGRELPLLRTALRPWQFAEPRHAWACLPHGSAMPKWRCTSFNRPRRSILPIPTLQSPAAYTSRPWAGSGRLPCLGSQESQYATTALPSTRRCRQPGAVSNSVFSGAAVILKSESTVLNRGSK